MYLYDKGLSHRNLIIKCTVWSSFILVSYLDQTQHYQKLSEIIIYKKI